MRKFSLIFLLFTTAFAFPAVAQHFHFAPVYNYNKGDLVKQLKTTKTDTGKLNLLFSLAFDNNGLVESPAYIDTGYLSQIIITNERARLFDDQPFRTLQRALREGAKNNYAVELTLLKAAIGQFDEQNTEVVMLLIETRWIFNVANQQEGKYEFYTKKLNYYLQNRQYRNAAACYHCLAGYYSFKSDYNSSINNYLKAGELFKDFSNLWYAHEFSVVGDRYANWGNYAKGLFYLDKGVKLDTKFGFELDARISLTSFATMEYALKHYQVSLDYLPKSSGGTDSFNDYFHIMRALDYTGLNRMDDASQEIKKLKAIPNESDLSFAMTAGYYDIDFAFYKYYLAIKNLSAAGKYLENAYRKAKKGANVEEEISYLKELQQFYGGQNNTAKAWQYTVLYNQANDSLRMRTSTFNVASYESEQKENEQNKRMVLLQQQRAVQQAIIGQRNIIIWISLIGLAAVLGSLIFIYRQLQVNKHNLAHLKTTQTQLIQSEKMASLGELTAGIAHEIQNPLNFVNNFSEVNTELIDELLQEIEKGNFADVTEIAVDIKGNEQKINQHGKRADGIVKGMLEHSRASSGQKELTDINALADEYMRLSYHGLRAKDKSFNAAMDTHLDDSLPKVNLVSQDIGRVLLNLYNNAFYAVSEKKKQNPEGYLPQVTLTTANKGGFVEIAVKDNGNGIPDDIKDKIMQPFFTTKPAGEGTGLGLSLSYDIVVKGHGGNIQVNALNGEFTEFTVALPLT